MSDDQAGQSRCVHTLSSFAKSRKGDNVVQGCVLCGRPVAAESLLYPIGRCFAGAVELEEQIEERITSETVAANSGALLLAPLDEYPDYEAYFEKCDHAREFAPQLKPLLRQALMRGETIDCGRLLDTLRVRPV